MQEKIPGLNLVAAPHTGVEREDRGESYRIGNAGQAGHEYRAKKRSQVHYRQHRGSTQSAPGLKRHYGKEVLSQIVHNSTCAVCPAYFDQARPQHDALTETPEVVNEDPYDRGWMIIIRPPDSSQLEALLTTAQYEAFIREGGGS